MGRMIVVIAPAGCHCHCSRLTKGRRGRRRAAVILAGSESDLARGWLFLRALPLPTRYRVILRKFEEEVSLPQGPARCDKRRGAAAERAWRAQGR